MVLYALLIDLIGNGMTAESTFRPRGTVYGTLLNYRREYDAWQSQMNLPPYRDAPKAPVLYVKPANTWTSSGDTISVPARVTQVEIGASVAAVIGDAGAVAGYVLVNDLSIPHDSYYRPPVKYNALDGFLGFSDAMRNAAAAGNPAEFKLTVKVNREVVQTVQFSELVRPASQLLQDVGEFMTLRPGDWLLLGLDVAKNGYRPRAQVGDDVEITGTGFVTLKNSLVAEIAV